MCVHVCCCSAGAQALRCLALAYKSVPQASSSNLSPLDEAGLTFIAMVAMHDPPRRECAAAIQLCRQVRACVFVCVVLISGFTAVQTGVGLGRGASVLQPSRCAEGAGVLLGVGQRLYSCADRCGVCCGLCQRLAGAAAASGVAVLLCV
jgi:hypothetical protein